MTQSPSRFDRETYFDVRRVAVPEVPEARTTWFKVDHQSFLIGPDYHDNLQEAEWYIGCFQTALERLFARSETQRPEDEQPTCPVCGGDCSGANPPVANCPLKLRSDKDDEVRMWKARAEYYLEQLEAARSAIRPTHISAMSPDLKAHLAARSETTPPLTFSAEEASRILKRWSQDVPVTIEDAVLLEKLGRSTRNTA